MAAHAFGDHQGAVAHLEEALRGSRHFGDQATEAMILAGLGYVHLPSDPLDCSSGDARRCLAAAFERARALGMHPLQKRAERLQKLATWAAGGKLALLMDQPREPIGRTVLPNCPFSTMAMAP